MKTANLTVTISTGMSVHKIGVTPLEALLLTAEHHKNAGGGVFAEAEVAEADKSAKDEKRADDEELDRLRARYGAGKVKAITAEVKDFPTTYKAAIERGVKIVLPSSALATTRLI